MAIKLLLAAAVLWFCPAAGSAQLSQSSFGGIPLWADSALRAEGLGGRFMLSSTLNPVYGFGDFDRDGLIDVAVEIKDTGGLRCGIAIVHRIDLSVHIIGAGQPIGNGNDELRCMGSWSIVPAGPEHRHRVFGPVLLYIAQFGAPRGWLAWDGRSYVWVQAD